MSPSVPSQNGSDALLAEVVEEFTNRLQAGESVDVESYAQCHPEHADRLRQLLPALALLAEVGRSEDRGSDGVSRDAAEGSITGTLGDFRILREVGRGGMGIVYEAEQISLRRRVALKVLPFAATMDARHLQRFHNEAQAAACLHHTNIVPVFFVGCERGVHFYTMQFIDGQPLSDLIRQLRGREKTATMPAGEEQTAAYQPSPGAATPPPAVEMTPLTAEGRRGRDYYRKVAELGAQAAEALDHAHQLGIVHRDIKPGNLLVDGRGNLWVTDFGLAHMQHGEANLTVTGQALGTPRYMSPEQALAKRVPIDHRTDVYSLGATLYELLTLRPAFESEDRQELLRQIAFDDPAKPRRRERAIPAELEIIVLKAMEKRPQDRYATAQELADDLERWLRHEPIRARRPTVLQWLRKWSRRHQAAVWATSLVLAIVLAVLAGSVGWVARDRTMQRAETERVVTAALEESASWQDKRRLPEALSAVHRAQGLLAGRPADAALQWQVQVRANDLELLDKLEKVRLERFTAVKDGHFDWEGADALYVQTFHDAGLEVETLPAEEVGERIRGTSIAVELAAVLDDWALLRREHLREDDSSWKRLFKIARLADANAWRTRVRVALETRDGQAMHELATAEEVWQLSRTTLSVIGSALLANEEILGRTEPFLRQAQRQHPDDFWLNYNLYEYFHTRKPPQWEEAVRFAGVAVALRPESPGAHNNLGLALRDKGQLDDAIAEYREAIRLKKDYAQAHDSLGNALRDKGQLDEAITEFRDAIRIKKDFAEAHVNLGVALSDMGQLDDAVAAYREAIRLKKDKVEAHANLGVALKDKGQLDEAIAECREAIRINKDDARLHVNLGVVLKAKGQLDEAIAAYREAIRLKKDDARVHVNLGVAMRAKGQLDEAIAAYREAIQLKKDSAEAHYNLGNALRAKGQLDEAIAEYRVAIRLKKDDAETHCSLGVALIDKGQLDEAIDEYREAIRLKKDYAEAHSNLGTALKNKGQLDEAIAEHREAIRLEKDYAPAHNNLGIALAVNGQLDKAIEEFREAIRIKKDYAKAHYNLGNALQEKGKFAEALVHYRRGHQLGSKNPRWPYPSAQLVRNCERLVELDSKLPAILNGQKQPADTAEHLALAQLCQMPCKKQHAAAVRFYSKAFADKPQLSDDLNADHRYNAACAAALAGCGQGKDADKLDDKERARLRQQALDWLRADLKAYRQLMEKSAGKAGPAIAQRLQHWLLDADFAGVRGEAVLCKLPEAERPPWQKLWQDVEALRQQAAGTTKSADNGHQLQRKEGSPNKD